MQQAHLEQRISALGGNQAHRQALRAGGEGGAEGEGSAGAQGEQSFEIIHVFALLRGEDGILRYGKRSLGCLGAGAST